MDTSTALETEELSERQTQQAADLSARLFEALVPAMELLTVELGVRRGLYASLRSLGSATAAELAAGAGLAPRYVQEWLEQQATAGIVEVMVAGDAVSRQYGLSPAQIAVLVNAESRFAMSGAGSFLIGMADTFNEVVADFAIGRGVAYDRYGASVRQAISSLNRPVFTHAMDQWFEALPDITHRLSSAPGVVVDLGCGTGWSTIALARRFPLARVLGIDLDPASITDAQANLAGSEVADRVRFVVADADDQEVLRAETAGSVVLGTVFEALHDMNEPSRSLRALGSVLEPGGAILVADERVASEFTPDGDLLERLNYGFSVLHCLPATIAEGHGEANGTVLRTSTVLRWAEQAGMLARDLGIKNELWRFYRLDRS